MSPRSRQTSLYKMQYPKTRHRKLHPELSSDAQITPAAAQHTLFRGFEPIPLIIPRPNHKISRKNIDKEALKVLYRLKDHGYLAYLVGGSVRDLLLNRKPKDFDIGTNARPEELRKIFRHSRIIGRRFRLVHVYFKGGKIIEVSTFRQTPGCNDDFDSDTYDENIYGTPEQDAFRRDLTINGLFYNIADFSIIDYVGGMEDLKNCIIRVIGDSECRFLRDPVRMLRAIRHAARTGFKIEPNTWNAIKTHADKIRLCSVARVRDEFLKDLHSGAAHPWTSLMLESGLLPYVFPGYATALSRENRPTTTKLLLKLSYEIDKIINNSRSPIDEAFLMAVFLYPAIHCDERFQSLYSTRLRWPIYETRSVVEDVLSPYDFRRDIRDHIAKILAGYWTIDFCVRENTWPRKVQRRDTFEASLYLYNKVQTIFGHPPAKFTKVKRRRRRPRPKRSK